jgi:putative transposase
MANLIQVIVSAANQHETKAGCDVLKATANKHPTLEVFFGDGEYRRSAVEFVEMTLQLTLHFSKNIKDVVAVLLIR